MSDPRTRAGLALRRLSLGWDAVARQIGRPWSDEAIAIDLVVYDDLAEHPNPHLRQHRPSLQYLAGRCGIGVKATRLRVNAHDLEVGHAEGTPRARRGHAEGTPETGAPRESGRKGHAEGTPRAQQGHGEGTALPDPVAPPVGFEAPPASCLLPPASCLERETQGRVEALAGASVPSSEEEVRAGGTAVIEPDPHDGADPAPSSKEALCAPVAVPPAIDAAPSPCVSTASKTTCAGLAARPAGTTAPAACAPDQRPMNPECTVHRSTRRRDRVNLALVNETEPSDLPGWAADVAAHQRIEAEEVVRLTGRAMEAIRGTVGYSDADAGLLLALWHDQRRPPWASLVDDVVDVADWAQHSEEPAAARSLRGDGWTDGPGDVSHKATTLLDATKFGDRRAMAKAWKARGRTGGRRGIGEYDETRSDAIGADDPRGTAILQTSYDTYGARGMPLAMLKRKGVRLTAADEAALAAEPPRERGRKRTREARP